MNIADDFIQTWNELGDKHNQLSEAQRIEKELHLFDLKKKLTASDVPVILEHTDKHRMIRKALLGFLS